MTHTEELMKLAEAATPGPWHADGEHDYKDCVCTSKYCITSDLEEKDASFIAAANPETIKQLVELVRLQHESVKQYAKMMPLYQAGIDAIAAFNRFEQGGSDES